MARAPTARAAIGRGRRVDERLAVFFQAEEWAQRRIAGVNRCEHLRLPGAPVFDALDPRPARTRFLGEVWLETAPSSS